MDGKYKKQDAMNKKHEAEEMVAVEQKRCAEAKHALRDLARQEGPSSAAMGSNGFRLL